jgi:predicted dehydrogenase
LYNLIKEGQKMKIGILATGKIAHTMAQTLTKMRGVEKYAIASRTLEKAQEFQKEMNFEKAYGSYEELCLDPEVELVYIASPHSEHYSNMKMCIEHHKPILCEKSFCVNYKQAKEVLDLAEDKKVFCTEAIWTRYMPSRKMIDDLIASGIIGDVYLVVANLGYPIKHNPRIVNPKLGGGSLLDVGVYPINFAQMVYKEFPETINGFCTYTNTGVDETDSYILSYKDKKQAYLYASMDGVSDRKGIIYGTGGYIKVININNPERIEVYLDRSGKPHKVYKVPKQISGYEYQVSESIKCIQENEIQSEFMSHEETLNILKIMDKLREEMKIVYPFE